MPDTSSITLEEAKAITLERAAEIAAQFPAEYTGETRVAGPSRSLYTCEGDENFQWPGLTKILVTGTPDQDAVVDAIAAAWEARSGWSVERIPSSNGSTHAMLSHTDGDSYRVGFYAGGDEFWVDAASPCFHLEGGLTPGAEY